MEQEMIIFRYLDGESSEAEQQQVQHLLETDTEFRALFQQIQSSEELVNNYFLQEPSANFTSSILRQINGKIEFNMFDSTLLKVFAGLLLCLGILFAVHSIYNPNSSIFQALQPYVLPSMAVLFVFATIEFYYSYTTKFD